MSATPTVKRRVPSAGRQPDFWKRYSPRGEFPLSFTISVVLHIAVVFTVLYVLVRLNSENEGDGNKPSQMDIVQIESGGGGLGDIGSIGIGKNKTGVSGRTEGIPDGSRAPTGELAKIQDFKFNDVKPDATLVDPDDPNITKDDGDPFEAIERQRIAAEKILNSQYVDRNAKSGVGDGFKGGSKGGPPGGAGGPPGPGLGKGTGGGTGGTLNEQRRHELKWQILASEDGEVHIRKLQALKVTLLVELPSMRGYALRYDLSKPGLQPEKIKFVDDPNKVRWQNKTPKELVALATVLRLPEVPVRSVIYLPLDLEADMARRELSHQGRAEWEIYKTIWDVRERDGVYDNEPFIVQQVLVTDMFRKK